MAFISTILVIYEYEANLEPIRWQIIGLNCIHAFNKISFKNNYELHKYLGIAVMDLRGAEGPERGGRWPNYMC